MGETTNQPFQLSFNAALRVEFQGSRVTSASCAPMECSACRGASARRHDHRHGKKDEGVLEGSRAEHLRINGTLPVAFPHEHDRQEITTRPGEVIADRQGRLEQ